MQSNTVNSNSSPYSVIPVYYNNYEPSAPPPSMFEQALNEFGGGNLVLIDDGSNIPENFPQPLDNRNIQQIQIDLPPPQQVQDPQYVHQIITPNVPKEELKDPKTPSPQNNSSPQLEQNYPNITQTFTPVEEETCTEVWANYPYPSYKKELRITPQSMTAERINFVKTFANDIIIRINEDIKEEKSRSFYETPSWFNVMFINVNDDTDQTTRIIATICFIAIGVIGVGSLVKEVGNLSRAKDYIKLLLAKDFEITEIKKKTFLNDEILKNRAVNLFTEPGQALYEARWEIGKRIIIKVATVVGAVLGAIGALCAIEALFTVGVLVLAVGGLTWCVNNFFFDNYKSILINHLRQLNTESQNLSRMFV